MSERIRISNEELNCYGTWIRTAGLELSQFRRNPVMLWMHQFPFRSGYRGMDHPFTGEEELLALLQGHNAYVCSGHLHTAVTRRQGSVTMMTAPAVSMLMELRPDTVRFYTGQSGFALHAVEGGQVTTHLCCVPPAESGGPYRFVH